MTRDFFDPTPEEQNVVLIDATTLQKAQRLIAGCEACSEDAELPFENILDRLTGLRSDYHRLYSGNVGEMFAVRWANHRKNSCGVGSSTLTHALFQKCETHSR